MRLRRLDLTRYGKFTDYSIDFGEHESDTPDLHIVYGLNEAGKSTALSAYLDLLFGIEERTRYSFLHQGKAMEIGACLEFEGSAHEFRRVKQRSNSLLDEHGQPVNEAVLGFPLAGLTRDAYRMMFSLDDQTLEDGGNAILEDSRTGATQSSRARAIWANCCSRQVRAWQASIPFSKPRRLKPMAFSESARARPQSQV